MKTRKETYVQDFDTPFSISNRNLLKIIDFYLFHCPVPGTSQRGKKFTDYGFRGSAAYSALKKAMLEAASPGLKGNYKPCLKEELKPAFHQVDTIGPPDEYCVFLRHDEKTVMCSLFSAIRNALAHGSFTVKAYHKIRIYFFANHHKDCTKAKIVLREDTLLAWIKLVQAGYGTQHKK